MYYLLQLTTTMPDSSGASTGTSITGIAKILALIGTLFAVLNAPSGISQLIGSDLSVSSALQSLQTTLIGSSLLGGAARMIGSTAKDAAALTTYGVGRSLGGSSIAKQIQSIATGAPGNPLVSDRATLGGIQGGLNNLNESSNPSLGDFASGMISNGLPNIAKPISNINESSGSFSDVIRNTNYSTIEKVGRVGLKTIGWGSSRAYAAASNRVASIGKRGYSSKPIGLNNPSMMNVTSSGGNET